MISLKIKRPSVDSTFPVSVVPSDAPHYPLIVKKGVNDLGKELCYYLNYSKDPVSVVHHGKNGVELLSETAIACGDKINLDGWGVAVVEM